MDIFVIDFIFVIFGLFIFGSEVIMGDKEIDLEGFNLFIKVILFLGLIVFIK